MHHVAHLFHTNQSDPCGARVVPAHTISGGKPWGLASPVMANSTPVYAHATAQQCTLTYNSTRRHSNHM
jgi:hypothetical protein